MRRQARTQLDLSLPPPARTCPLLRWACLIALFILKRDRAALVYTAQGGNSGNLIFNVTLASCLLLGVGSVAAYTAGRMYHLRVQRCLRWVTSTAEVAMCQRQVLLYAYLCNALLWLAPNCYALAKQCGPFTTFVIWAEGVRWLFINLIMALICVIASHGHWTARYAVDEGGEDAHVVMSWAYLLHASPLIILFVGSSGVIIASAAVASSLAEQLRLGDRPCVDALFLSTCLHHGLYLSRRRRWLMYAQGVLLALYGVLFSAYLLAARRMLRRQPYMTSRRRRASLRFLIWSTYKVLLTAVAAVALSMFVGPSSCSTRVIVDYGFAPLQIVLAVYVAVHGVLISPVAPDEERASHVAQQQLQLFAWREHDVPEVVARRSEGAKRPSRQLNAEPVFCVETASKLLSWSFAAYERAALTGADLRHTPADGLFIRDLHVAVQPVPQLPTDVPIAVEVQQLKQRRAGVFKRLWLRIWSPHWLIRAKALEMAAQKDDAAAAHAAATWFPGLDPRGMVAFGAAALMGAATSGPWAASPPDRNDGDVHDDDAESTSTEPELNPDLTEDAALAAVVIERRQRRRRLASALLPKLLATFDLLSGHVLLQPALAIKALVAWGPDALVIAFRGSAAVSNFRLDARVGLVVHPPRRQAKGMPHLRTAIYARTPAVHTGFWTAYTAGDMRGALLARFRAAMQRRRQSGATSPLRVYCTGHSMGGALAQLVAYDITAAWGAAVHTTVVTFGCPRAGNHAFACDFNRIVPDCWNVVHGRDSVFHTRLWLLMYKHPGKRVVLRPAGEGLLVRPSFIETTFESGDTLLDHRIKVYLTAMDQLLTAEAQRHPEMGRDLMYIREQLVRSVLRIPLSSAAP